jgi:hypothetical protein
MMNVTDAHATALLEKKLSDADSLIKSLMLQVECEIRESTAAAEATEKACAMLQATIRDLNKRLVCEIRNATAVAAAADSREACISFSANACSNYWMGRADVAENEIDILKARIRELEDGVKDSSETQRLAAFWMGCYVAVGEENDILQYRISELEKTDTGTDTDTEINEQLQVAEYQRAVAEEEAALIQSAMSYEEGE